MDGGACWRDIPQSSVAPNWSFGIHLLASSSASLTSSGVSTRGSIVLITPTKAICIRPGLVQQLLNDARSSRGCWAHLHHTLGIPPDGFGDLFVHPLLVGLTRGLDEKVTSVDLEYAWQQFRVVDLSRMCRVALAARAGVNANVYAFFGRKTIKDSIQCRSV